MKYYTFNFSLDLKLKCLVSSSLWFIYPVTLYNKVHRLTWLLLIIRQTVVSSVIVYSMFAWFGQVTSRTSLTGRNIWSPVKLKRHRRTSSEARAAWVRHRYSGHRLEMLWVSLTSGFSSQASSGSVFEVGMKLEAVDRKNPCLVCVASVADIVDQRFLVHFDNWDDTYDYWLATLTNTN